MNEEERTEKERNFKKEANERIQEVTESGERITQRLVRKYTEPIRKKELDNRRIWESSPQKDGTIMRQRQGPLYGSLKEHIVVLRKRKQIWQKKYLRDNPSINPSDPVDSELHTAQQRYASEQDRDYCKYEIKDFLPPIISYNSQTECVIQERRSFMDEEGIVVLELDYEMHCIPPIDIQTGDIVIRATAGRDFQELYVEETTKQLGIQKSLLVNRDKVEPQRS